jgi:streptogramin lyase
MVAALSMVVSVATPSEAADPGGAITEYPVPGAPAGITVGSDGNLWVTNPTPGSPSILRITTTGMVTDFPLPGPYNDPFAITTGADGNLWFTEVTTDAIGRMTPGGGFTEFPVGAIVGGITLGRDGNVWFTEVGGTVTEYPGPSHPGATLGAITTGPDGNLWIAGSGSGERVISMTTAGAIDADFPVPIGVADITCGPDGKLWLSGFYQQFKVVSLTVDGVSTEYPTANVFSDPQGLAFGPDGRLWVALHGDNAIAAITTTGQFEEFPIPTPQSGPAAITAGPDGNMWFTEFGSVSRSNPVAPPGPHNVGKIGTGPEPPAAPVAAQPALTG